MPSTASSFNQRALALVRAGALLLFGGLAAYLIALLAWGRLALWISRLAIGPTEKMLLGVLILDLGKLIGLLPVAWLIGIQRPLRPTLAAPILVGLHFLFELLVMSMVEQARWIWSPAWIAATRGSVLLLLIVPVYWVMVRQGDRSRDVQDETGLG